MLAEDWMSENRKTMLITRRCKEILESARLDPLAQADREKVYAAKAGKPEFEAWYELEARVGKLVAVSNVRAEDLEVEIFSVISHSDPLNTAPKRYIAKLLEGIETVV